MTWMRADDEVRSNLSIQITSILVRFPVTPLMLRVDISGEIAEVAKLNTMEWTVNLCTWPEVSSSRLYESTIDSFSSMMFILHSRSCLPGAKVHSNSGRSSTHTGTLPCGYKATSTSLAPTSSIVRRINDEMVWFKGALQRHYSRGVLVSAQWLSQGLIQWGWIAWVAFFFFFLTNSAPV